MALEAPDLETKATMILLWFTRSVLVERAEYSLF